MMDRIDRIAPAFPPLGVAGAMLYNGGGDSNMDVPGKVGLA